MTQAMGGLIYQQQELDYEQRGNVLAGILPLHTTKNYLHAAHNDGMDFPHTMC